MDAGALFPTPADAIESPPPGARAQRHDGPGTNVSPCGQTLAQARRFRDRTFSEMMHAPSFLLWFTP
jgi:hypothetical protein